MKPLCQLILLLVLGGVAGCGSETVGPPLFPVSGKVTMDGKPVTTGGTVSFRSDDGLHQPSSVIKADGTYSLKNGDVEGAPTGQYKVIVFITSHSSTGTEGNSGLPSVIGNRKFMDPSTTPLRVEVTEHPEPNQYDLAVTK